MRTPKLTRAQRRMEKLADRIDLISEADRRYFERFPRGRYRVRVASQLEIEMAELLGLDMSLPPGSQHYVTVRFLTPSIRSRMMLVGPADPELMSERAARTIIETYESKFSCGIPAGLLESGRK
jgi:hypothetical protein